MKKIVVLLLSATVISLAAWDQPDLRYLFGPNANVPYFSYLHTGSWGDEAASTRLNNAINDGGQMVAQNEVVITNVYYNKEGWVKVGNKSLTGNWAVIGDVCFDVSGNVFREGAIVRGFLAGSIPASKFFSLNLRNVDFGTTDISRSDFSFSDLTNARLDRAQVADADFSCAIGLTDQQKKNLKDRGAIIVEGQNCKDKLDQRIKEFIKNGGSPADLKHTLKLGGNVNLPSENGMTLLILAAQNKNTNTFIEDLIKKGADCSLKDQQGSSAFEYAVARKIPENIEALVDCDLQADIMKNCGNDEDCAYKMVDSRLIKAVTNNYQNAVIEYYLKRDAHIDIHFGENQITSLFYAVVTNNIPLVQLLIDNNADLEATNKYGDTPLIIACWNNDEDIAKLLVNAGANVNAKNEKGYAPLHCVAAKMPTALGLVELLLQKGAIIDAEDLEGNTPFLLAVNSRNFELAEFLLKVGARIDHIPKDNINALLMASSSGNIDLVKRCLESKSMNINQQNEHGVTSLMFAVFNDHAEVVMLLIHAGVSIDLVQHEGLSALMVAARDGKVDMVKILLDAGANYTLKDNQGFTALAHAQIKNHSDVAELLENWVKTHESKQEI